MIRFKSRALQAEIKEPDCAVCRFLDGSRDTPDLIRTISVLDAHLAQAEDANDKLIELLAKMERETRELAHE